MMSFNRDVLFFFLFLSTFYILTMSRVTPRKALSLGGNERKIIHVLLKKFIPGAYALVSVGDPPVQSQLHIDTGSDLTWVLHNPRSGYEPLRSSSFSYSSCAGLSKSPFVTKSNIKGQCKYNQWLADDARYEGTLGTETFSFETGDRGLGTMKNVLFGFGNTTEGIQTGEGTLGLNVRELSIVNSLGGKFSICIGNFNDPHRGKHFLALGDDTVFGGISLSLDTKEKDYRINLNSIIIDGENLGVGIFLSKSNTVLDTGTSTISLVTKVYQVFVEKIKKKMSDAGYEESYIFREHNMICYEGDIPEHKKLQVAFKFEKEKLEMKTTELFIQIDDDQFCLSANESPLEDINLIGIPLFQGRNVGFDIPNKKLYIKKIECIKLLDSYKDELDHPNHV